MAETDKKALIIKTKKGTETPAELETWTKLGGVDKLISNIDAGEVTSVNMEAIVTGIPSIFARAHMFRSAMTNREAQDGTNSGLTAYYEQLLSEWKGFIACIALDNSHLKVCPIRLAYSDGKDVENTSNIYEPKGAFGTMLFESHKKWSRGSLPDNDPDKDIPYIYVIEYNDQVVGATSPDCFLFTSTKYEVESTEASEAFVDANGKFTNPMPTLITKKADGKIASIYAYIKHLRSKIQKFIEQFDNDAFEGVPLMEKCATVLRAWEEEILSSTSHFIDKELLEKTPVPEVNIFDDSLCPFAVLFNNAAELWGRDGIITSDRKDEYIKFSISELLLPPSRTDLARVNIPEVDTSSINLLQKFPMHVMPAIIPGKKNAAGLQAYAFFALPLSAKGLNVFGSQISNLCSTTALDKRHSLRASYNGKDELKVTLQITVDNVPIPKTVMYKVDCYKMIDKEKIILWPNIISRMWKRYFLYSELPHTLENSRKYRATPIVIDVPKIGEDTPILLDHENKPVLLAENGAIKSYPVIEQEKGLKAKLLVTSKECASAPYQYEIYESNKPFRGIHLSSCDGKCDSGYLLIKFDNDRNTDSIPDNWLSSHNEPLKPAKLGIDFGSTNTSVAFSVGGATPQSLQLHNNSVSLLSINQKVEDSSASRGMLHFFQRKEVASNSLKSILTTHDGIRINKQVDTNGNELTDLDIASQEVSGGFPCFETNLDITDVSEKSISATDSDRQDKYSLVWNMKWEDDEISKSNRTAYLRSLLLHISAELFISHDNAYPAEINWSYPSAMSGSIVRNYNLMWQSVGRITDDMPVCNVEEDRQIPVSLTVARYQDNDNVFNMFNQDSTAKSAPQKEVVEEDNPFAAFFNAPTPTSVKEEPKVEETTSDIPQGEKTGLEIEDGYLDFRQIENIGAATGCMTEACAVANFLAKSVTAEVLTLCFDVGGSTTDISAFTCHGNNRLLIKQNSIHFAAQNVIKAAGMSPNLKDVLLNAQKHEPIFGLREKYSSETAAYYFDKVVDLISDDPERLTKFYTELVARCPELMSVNLYVTGMIMFYAGQITRKLVMMSRNQLKDWRPVVRIIFAGKGSRIFDWWYSSSQEVALGYYTMLYAFGMGAANAQQMKDYIERLNIELKDDQRADVKYEVSKGLITEGTNLSRLIQDSIEIIGEDGYHLPDPQDPSKHVELPFDKVITSAMLEQLGGKFGYNNKLKAPPQFKKFFDVFNFSAKKFFDISFDKIKADMADMDLDKYISEDEDYRMALKNKSGFDFVAPIIIMEAGCFLKDILKELKKQKKL